MSDNVIIDTALVTRLVAKQFPHWASLRVSPVEAGGWDNRTFRLGDQMVLRLPSAVRYAPQVAKEQHWLPRLAPFLPLTIPVPLAMGCPADGYPWHWSIYRWIDGETAALERIADLPRFALELAAFLRALQGIDAAGGPPPGPHNFFRGGSLATYDGETRRAIAILGDRIDAKAVTRVWDTALAKPWSGSPVWLHGDVSKGNLLVASGLLSAVIDFGSSGVGDPACDMSIAWTLLAGESRATFRSALGVDSGTWSRGRGWALWKAVVTVAEQSAPIGETVSASHRVIDEVLADLGL